MYRKSDNELAQTDGSIIAGLARSLVEVEVKEGTVV